MSLGRHGSIPLTEENLLNKLSAAAEGKGFYEWLKDDLIQTCPDERTLLQMLEDIRRDRPKS
jgi:hypothetical protein